MMEVEERWRKVPVGESWGYCTLAVVHWCKCVRTIVEWQMNIFLYRNGDPKRTWLLARNWGIARGFSSGSQNHKGWRGQRIGQVGGALHLERCPVEVHVWTEERVRKNFSKGRRRRWFLLCKFWDNVQDPWKGSEEMRWRWSLKGFGFLKVGAQNRVVRKTVCSKNLTSISIRSTQLGTYFISLQGGKRELICDQLNSLERSSVQIISCRQLQRGWCWVFHTLYS